MKNKLMRLDVAVQTFVKDRMSIAAGGFPLARQANIFIKEILRQNKKGLITVCMKKLLIKKDTKAYVLQLYTDQMPLEKQILSGQWIHLNLLFCVEIFVMMMIKIIQMQLQ